MDYHTDIRLYREVDNRIRYYFINLYKNLFSEYILQRKYGNIKYKRPTGIKVSYFKHFDDAIKTMKTLVEIKYKKGYREIDERNDMFAHL